MGCKGSKLTEQTTEAANQVIDTLGPLGDVTHRKMFGGYGIYEGGKMFALVNSAGALFLKADDTNRHRFEEAGTGRHGKMPYFEVPRAVRENVATFLQWAEESVRLSK